MKFIKFLAFFVAFLSITNAAKILCLIDVISEKNQIWDTVLFNALAAKGHSLTVVSTRWNEKLDESIDYIDMKTSADIKFLFDEEYSWMNTLLWHERINGYCRGMLEPHIFKKLQNIHFDMILYDVTYGRFCSFHFVQLWENATIIGISGSKITAEAFEMVRGGTYNPACVPHPQSLYSGKRKMYFLPRLYNFFFYGLNHFSRTVLKNKVLTKAIYQITPDIQDPLRKAKERIKVILVNSNPAINYVQPLPLNVIEVGGLHIGEPKLLPEKTSSFMFNTNKKIIFISLIDMKYKYILFRTIILCPQYAFVWNTAYDVDTNKVLENLHCAAELSQNDILAHKKVVLFITSAEDMDLQDAAYHGVPIIALPQYAHQQDNAQRAYQLNFGAVLDPEFMTSYQLADKIKSMEANPTYYSAMKYNQLIFRHQEREPLKTAVRWIEEILARPFQFDHLVSDLAKDYNFFILHSWDILMLGLAFLGLIITFSLLLLFLYLNPKIKLSNWIYKWNWQLDTKPELRQKQEPASAPEPAPESESELESELELELESELELGRGSKSESEPGSEPETNGGPEPETDEEQKQSSSNQKNKRKRKEKKKQSLPLAQPLPQPPPHLQTNQFGLLERVGKKKKKKNKRGKN